MSREVMQMALDALEDDVDSITHASVVYSTIEALRAELAKPEPEPVMWIWTDIYGVRGANYVEPDPKSCNKFNVEPLYRKDDVI
jgi:hypothetical protein